MHASGLRTKCKGYRVWNYDSERVEITRSVVFQELPKSRYVEVVSGQEITQHVHQYDDDDNIQVQLPHESIENEHKPMDVNQIGTRPISPLREYDSMSISPDIDFCPDPAFEIDDVNMEPVDVNVDVDPAQAIVPRGGSTHITNFSEMVPSRYGGHNDATALSPSLYSQALIPLSLSEAVVPGRSDDQADRAPKRYRIEYEQANAALEAPLTYQDAICSPQAKMWKNAIEAELNALLQKTTWSAVTKIPSHKDIGTNWVFAIKRNEHREVDRFRARLVAL